MLKHGQTEYDLAIVNCDHCNFPMKINYLETHIKNECEGEQMTCFTKDYGCDFKGTSKKLLSHENESGNKKFCLLLEDNRKEKLKFFDYITRAGRKIHTLNDSLVRMNKTAIIFETNAKHLLQVKTPIVTLPSTGEFVFKNRQVVRGVDYEGKYKKSHVFSLSHMGINAL